MAINRLTLIPAALFLHLPCITAQQTQTDTFKSTQTLPNAPRPDPDGIYRVGNGVSAPVLLSAADPAFSESARKKKIRGSCRVSVVVDDQGNTTDLKVVRSVAEDNPGKLHAVAETLDQEALEAVRQYHFKPGRLNGKPVSVALTIEVNFQIF